MKYAKLINDLTNNPIRYASGEPYNFSICAFPNSYIRSKAEDIAWDANLTLQNIRANQILNEDRRLNRIIEIPTSEVFKLAIELGDYQMLADITSDEIEDILRQKNLNKHTESKLLRILSRNNEV